MLICWHKWMVRNPPGGRGQADAEQEIGAKEWSIYMIKELATLLVLVIGLAAGPLAAASIIDNNEIYAWGDPFGDQFDNYAEVVPGETIKLQVWVNDLNGSVDLMTGETLVNQNWVCAADGTVTDTWWDPTVIDGLSVNADTTGNYYTSYWPLGRFGSREADHWQQHYEDPVSLGGTVRWIAESRHIISLNYTIRADAPLGLTTIALSQGFSWYANMGDEYYGFFFFDRLDVGDPYAMQLNVVPEPATMSLLAMGACLPLFRRKRR